MKVDLGGRGKGGEWVTINIDDSEHWAAPDFVADITAEAGELEDILQENSVEAIRCIHTLEHLPSWDIGASLKYWLRFLMPGGKLLVVVPDMERTLIDCYDGFLSWEAFVCLTFNPPSYTRKSPYQTHRWGFNEKSLKADMEAAGYRMVATAGRGVWDAGWALDFAETESSGLNGKYIVQNLRMVGVK